jgi:hypothetical protein
MPVTRGPAGSVSFGSARDVHNFISDRNYKDTHRNKSKNYIFGCSLSCVSC